MVQVITPTHSHSKKLSFKDRLLSGAKESAGMVSNLAGNYQRQQEQAQAIQKMGLDPSILSLPEHAQAEYFKKAFSTEKSLTPLQIAQQHLAEERLNALKGQQDLFSKLTSGNQENEFNSMEGEGQQRLPQEGQGQLSKLPKENLMQLSAFAGQPGQQGVIGNMAKAELDRQGKENSERTSKEKQFFKLNEPKLMELSDTQRKLETEAMRYEKLNNLFQDPSKFPSSFTAALFTKDGNINDIVYSQLTPEAQESIKLIIDSTSNIKDTYGARITNFDLQTYLKKLPSLLNSPEGKQRVLRDLQIMNELNRLHASGIQEIFEESGGSDKIPYSTAESRYKKRYGEIEKELKDKFINPDKGIMKSLPNPDQYLGKKIKNEETGEILISDGNEWKPFKG